VTPREAASRSTTREFPNILLTWKFITLFTRTLDCSLSRTRLIQSIPPYPISLRSILILSSHLRVGLPVVSFLLAFLPKSYMHSSLPHGCYMPCLPWQEKYSCIKVLHSTSLVNQFFLNFLNLGLRNRLANETSAVYVALETTAQKRTQ
jgi:hypothetical protein